jgi:hypothetical protein
MSHKVSTEGFREAARTALFALVSRCVLRKRKEPVGVEPVSAIVEPVSRSPKRKLEKPEQRLARQPVDVAVAPQGTTDIQPVEFLPLRPAPRLSA